MRKIFLVVLLCLISTIALAGNKTPPPVMGTGPASDVRPMYEPATKTTYLPGGLVIGGTETIDGAISSVNLATLAALQAYTGSDTTVYVQGRIAAGDGYEGVFNYLTGDYSTEATADTLHDNYVAKSGVATSTGCWVRSKAVISDRLELTTDTVLTTSQLLLYKYITNQGAASEIDLTLPAVSYSITRAIIIEESQNIEINPPSGELFDLDGTLLDADDCVDSDSVVGSKIIATRMKIADGSWRWSLDTVRGTWVDTGASD